MQRRVEHLFDGPGPVHNRACTLAGRLAAPEHLVRDVEGRQHRRRNVSCAVPLSAAAFIFSSTYAASSAMYAGSSVLRIGYRWPWMKTGTTRSEGSDNFYKAAGCRLRLQTVSGPSPSGP
jgi:hypothetical protein